MISTYKKQFEPLIAIIARPFLSWNPSVLTMLSLVSALVFFFSITLHIYWLSILSMFGFVFDALDGYVARKRQKVSAYGAFLDSNCDRVADFLVIASFGFGHLVSFELTIVLLGTTFLISYMRARAEAVFGKERPLAKGLMQRTERILFLFILFLFFLFFPIIQFFHFSLLAIGFAVLCILNCFTIFQRFFI